MLGGGGEQSRILYILVVGAVERKGQILLFLYCVSPSQEGLEGGLSMDGEGE